ncbi:MAG: hypothetical protein K8R02_08730 [Anaerohalosphaeraceae bacterium]|nr:hypothetical protein [Anaerohalosphaeraceae bacterium]
MKNSQIIDGNRWVTHFDILGFKSRVESMAKDRLNDTQTSCIAEICEKALEECEKNKDICKFIFFSDSFIFYTDDASQDSFKTIELVSAMFFHEMFHERIPMRGCLSTGRFYTDEEKRIFFGPAHIDAYELAEGQNWIGFVLSEKTKEKLASFERTGFKSNHNLRFLEYEVPYKKDPCERKLLTYNLKLLSKPSSYQLLDALDNMKHIAYILNPGLDFERDEKFGKIITKYENTEKFIKKIYSEKK